MSIRFLSKTDVMENTDYNVTPKFIIPNHGRGFYGIGIYGGKTPLNIGSLWRSAHILKADFIFTIGKRYKTMPSDTMKTWKHIPLFEFDYFRQFKDSMAKGSEIVGIELNRNSIALTEFTHPERAIYLLGAEDYGLPQEILDECDSIVQIPGENSLNVAVAGSIVLYDRLSKEHHNKTI